MIYAGLPMSESLPPILIIIPCLNEIRHIDSLVRYLVHDNIDIATHIVIADGGSVDGTVAAAQKLAAEFPHVTYWHNPKKLQSAAVNLAVERYGDGHEILVRIDAHADYPPGFIKALLAEAKVTGADAVAAPMDTVGVTPFQRAVAAAQNSKLGNGGSAHRNANSHGQWVDHGHHALIKVAAFRAVGGYDENFSHNEDAELDTRLIKAGYKIWLTGKTFGTYYPRSRPWPLFKQYRGYGRGRARNILKHKTRPKLRQMLPVLVFPAVLGVVIAPSLLIFIPAAIWGLVCFSYGVWLGLRARDPAVMMMAGLAAMIMHLAWSMGFWQEIIAAVIKRARRT